MSVLLTDSLLCTNIQPRVISTIEEAAWPLSPQTVVNTVRFTGRGEVAFVTDSQCQVSVILGGHK